jgi:hypothetical protein
VNQSDGTDKTITYIETAWLAGWDSESDKKFKDQPDNFETMPDVEPEPEPEKVTSVPSTGPAKSVPQAITMINDRFINTPETMSSFFSYGVNLDGLKLEHLNSIIDGFDRILTKYDIRLNYVGWNKRKQSCTAVYQRFGGSHAGISFQKTATKGVKSKQKKTLENFANNKAENIEKWQRYLTYPEARPGAHEVLHNRIARMEACNRWTIDSSTDDPLAVTAAHEANHAMYYKYNLRALWEQNLSLYLGDLKHHDVKCASVSEYGMTSVTELFAEVGAAIAFDVEIDSHVKQAYLDTIAGIKT